MKQNHDLLKLAIDKWQSHKHSHYTDVTLRQFLGVFYATMEAVRERQGLDKSDMVASLACEPADDPK